ncbi:MAG: histidine phosphatase family protein [Candidatus Pacebacteria bacterium]|nr:histidine phosphatase family protein [Candidatus Paceibacterota bacterium]
MWTKALHEREWQPPVGDSSVVAGRRLEKIIEKLCQEKNDSVVLVTHGGIITDFLRNVFPLNTLCQFISDFETTLDKNIKECSITVVEAEPTLSTLRLKQLAYVGHLYDT